MIKRWVALGVAGAQRGFRRVKGHGQTNLLLAAPAPTEPAHGVADAKKVA